MVGRKTSMLKILLRVIFVIILSCVFNLKYVICSDDCTCHPVQQNFDERIEDSIGVGCRKCYQFTYDFTLDQDWAARVCVNSPTASKHAPLLVTVREHLSVLSFQVPQMFNDRIESSYPYVCHTLCPLANYFDEKLTAGKQNITVEIATEETARIGFTVEMFMIKNFTIKHNETVSVKIFPSQPQTMQYNLQKGQRAGRIEVISPDNSCMILSIQNIQCPFSDSEKTIQQSGVYQTLMTQSGIALTKNFPMDHLYIVLLLKTTDDDCIDYGKHGLIPAQNMMKEVTVKVVTAISDRNYYLAVFGAIAVYVLIYIYSFIICLCFSTRSAPVIQIEGGSEQLPTTSTNNEATKVNLGIDEIDMDTVADADVDKNIVRTKTVLHVADLARTKEKHLSKRSKIYSWNLLTIAIFYSLPVIQLVYINQRIVNLTGNQDICYYNFLCSHQVFVFSDFNHVFSNIGYLSLGLLFMCLVWRREILHAKKKESGPRQECNPTGIPDHFGLLYAMGLALIIEGVLSSCYHVCPNKANFQFDTAFMYVIALLCMLKLYQARHPDVTAESHTTWVALSVVIFCGVGGVLDGGIVYWILFVLIHLTFTLLVSFKIYYVGCIKYDMGIFKRTYRHIQQSRASKSYGPQYKGRFFLLLVAVLGNVALDVYAIVQQPSDFATYILIVFISNLLMYLLYYIFMKLRHREEIGWIPWLYIVLAVVFWIFAAIYFLEHNTSWKLTPAESRENNKHCIILDFYDHHDVWHFISSCALFFSFMVLFTLDDKLENISRKRIKVF